MASRSAQDSIFSKKRKRDLAAVADDGDSDDSDAGRGGGAAAAATSSKKPYKSKVLILSSRGITYHMRHLMNDVADLVTHGKRDTKLDTKHTLPLINELAELSSCNHALFFEARRRSDLYLWAARCPNGPSVRFHVVTLHTMGEVKMTGNCLKGSRPIVTFGQEFESSPSLRICKEVLTSIFAVPKTARKAKPFVDHVVSFSILDGKIWFRNYQIIDKPPTDVRASDHPSAEPNGKPSKKKSKPDPSVSALSLAEVGPRFVLVPIKIFEGSFGGPCLWENKEFVPPRKVLREQKLEAAEKHAARRDQDRSRERRKLEREVGRKQDGLEKRAVFA